MGVNTTIVAFENNTRVTIISPHCSEKSSLNTGKLTIVLNRGESFTFLLQRYINFFPKISENYKSDYAGGVTIQSEDSCKPIAVYNFLQAFSAFLQTFEPLKYPDCDMYVDCIQRHGGKPFAIQLLPDNRLSNEYLLVPNRMNRIQNFNMNIRWYYRTSHYYIQTPVDNEIWLNGKRYVVKADSFLCDTFITPIHVQALKPVHAFTVYMVPQNFEKPIVKNWNWIMEDQVEDIAHAATFQKNAQVQLATPPNLIANTGGNCVLVYAWNSDTVNVNGQRIRLRYRHGTNSYDTIGTRKSSTLYTLKNKAGLSAIFMNQFPSNGNYCAGGVSNLDPVAPVWQNRIAINRPTAGWSGFDDTGRVFVCRNNPARISAETGLDSPFKVYWYLQNILVDSGAVVQYTFKDTGSFRLRGRLLFKGGGCFAGLREENLYRNVSVYSDLHQKLPNDTLLCVGNSLQIQRNFNPRDRYKYLFTGAKLSCDTCPNQLLRPNRTNLQLRLTVTRAGCKSPFRDTLLINLRDSLKLQNTLPDTLCRGLWNGPLLRAKGGDSSAYRFVLYAQGRVVSLPLPIDSAFTLRLSVGDGCSAPADTLFKRFVVRPALKLLVRADTSICYGSALKPGFSASGGNKPYQVRWYVGSTPLDLTRRFYRDTLLMAVLDDACSRPDTAFMRLRVAPKISAAWLVAPPQRLCTDGILRFSAAAAGGLGNKNWYWLRNNRLLRSDSGTRFAHDATALPGSYRLTLRDACPASAMLDFTLLAPDMFKVRWNLPDTICPNTAWKPGIRTPASDSLLWFQSQILPTGIPQRQRFHSSDSFLNMQPLNPGIYRFLFTVGDGCMIPDSIIHRLRVTAPPVLPADTSINLCAASLFDYPLSAGSGWRNRFFLSDNGLPPVPASAISDRRVQGTRYTVEVIDRCGNNDLQNVELLRLQAFSGALLADTALCPHQSLLILTPTASNANLQPAVAALQWQLASQRANFTWKTGTAIPRPAFNTPDPGLYRLYFRASIGNSVCDSLHSNVLVYPAPVAAFSANRTRTFIEDPEFLFSNRSSGANRFQWHINGIDSGGAINLRFVAGDTGLYRVLLSAFNAEGCWDTAALNVKVFRLFRVFLPNAFTPGNDALNDTFEPEGTAISSFTMNVYNRWGQLVFKANEKTPFTGLDGQGNPLPEGVYVVSAVIESNYGERIFLNTSVHLLR